MLAELGDDARVLAGGQSLVPMLNLRLARPSALVDVGRVAALSGISANGALRLGATTRQADALRSPDVAERAPLLSDALQHVGHAATRSRGTLGGSIAHADPAAELPAVLLALDGEAVVRSPAGERTIPAASLFLGPFTTALADGELLTELRLPDRAGRSPARVRGDRAPPRRLRAGRRRRRRRPRPRARRALRRRSGRLPRGGRRAARSPRAPERRRRRSSQPPPRSPPATRTRRPPTGRRRRASRRCARSSPPGWRVPERAVRLRVNGRDLVGLAESRTLLSDFLRHGLGLTGTHVGCEHGACGACTVLVDGRPTLSCTRARGAGRGRRGDDGRGARGRARTASDPAGVPRAPRPAVRLLHAGDAAGGQGPARRGAGPERRRDPGSPRRQRLPLHGLRRHRRGGAHRGAGARGESRDDRPLRRRARDARRGSPLPGGPGRLPRRHRARRGRCTSRSCAARTRTRASSPSTPRGRARSTASRSS